MCAKHIGECKLFISELIKTAALRTTEMCDIRGPYV